MNTRDGSLIEVGDSLWELETHDGGESWIVTGPREVVAVSAHSFRYDGASFHHTDLGDVRTYASFHAAQGEANRRNALVMAEDDE